MPSLEDVFAKFGEVAEAGQLLETALGNLLLADKVKLRGLERTRNKVLARKILEDIDRKTLGQLIHALKPRPVPSEFELELQVALAERNRLNHSFYRQHNLRKTSEQGREVMLADLVAIHEHILKAYFTAIALSDIEISEEALLKAQSGHLPL